MVRSPGTRALWGRTAEFDRNVKLGLLSVLPFELTKAKRPVGLVTRANGSLSPAAALLIENIRNALADVERHDVS